MKEETKKALTDEELEQVTGGVELPGTKEYLAFFAQGSDIIKDKSAQVKDPILPEVTIEKYAQNHDQFASVVPDEATTFE